MSESPQDTIRRYIEAPSGPGSGGSEERHEALAALIELVRLAGERGSLQEEYDALAADFNAECDRRRKIAGERDTLREALERIEDPRNGSYDIRKIAREALAEMEESGE